MFEKLKKILVDELSINPDDITLSAELAKDLGINSLELMDLALICEETFGVSIDETKNLITVGDVVDYLEQNANN